MFCLKYEICNVKIICDIQAAILADTLALKGTLSSTQSPNMSLVSFLRYHLPYRGWKMQCVR